MELRDHVRQTDRILEDVLLVIRGQASSRFLSQDY